VNVHAARWVNGVIGDLGTLPGLPSSFAYGQNGTGQVVGTSTDDTGARAFLHLGGTMIDLNDLIAPAPGWTLQEARGINAAGQVAGWGTYNGQPRGFLMNLAGKIWSNPAGGAFASAGNWYSPGAPAAGQSVAFPLAATYTVGIASPAASKSVLVTRGNVTFDLAGGATYSVTETTTVRTGATLNVQGAGRLSTAVIDGGGTLRVTGGEVQLRLAGGTSAIGQLEFGGSSGAWTGRLDVTNNAVVIDYTGASPVAAVRDQVRSGRGSAGAWDGSGIASSVADAASIGVGYAEASALFSQFPATFAGRSVDDTSVLIRTTRYGDANLDGTVNLQDFNRLAAHFGATGAFWHDGDFNYDGSVNLADFNALAANFGLSAGADSAVDPGDWSALASSIPEPAALGAMFGSGVILVRRLRRRIS
jgi:probable HAF family extracellular repeat protein